MYYIIIVLPKNDDDDGQMNEITTGRDSFIFSAAFWGQIEWQTDDVTLRKVLS